MMGSSCGKPVEKVKQQNPSVKFARGMIGRCLEYAEAAKAEGRPVVGILCEFAPREIVMAAGGVPVCLCGGAAEMIPAAEQDLPAGLCPLIKSTYGYHVEEANPFLEMADLVIGETTCDGKKKMLELMGARRPVYLLELPQKQGDAGAFVHWECEVRKLAAALEARFGTRITEPKLRGAVRTMNRERKLRREIAGLMQAEAPPLTGRDVISFKSSISGIPEDLAGYAAALEYYRAREADKRNGKKVRVLMTGVPMVHGADRVLSLVEGHGGLVVCQENCTGLKPVLEDVAVDGGDLLHAIARKYFALPCSVMTVNAARLDWLRVLTQLYRPQCIIDLVYQGCWTYAIESALVRRLAEEELGLPYLRIDTDYGTSDSARLVTRIEALFEQVRQG